MTAQRGLKKENSPGTEGETGNIQGMFLPEVFEPEGMFEPGLQYLIEQITEASEALDHYEDVRNTAAVEMDQHMTIVFREVNSALDAALEFLKQLQEYERAQAQVAAVK
jgi:hypothetical protein